MCWYGLSCIDLELMFLLIVGVVLAAQHMKDLQR
jgi:hypothetical protein